MQSSIAALDISKNVAYIFHVKVLAISSNNYSIHAASQEGPSDPVNKTEPSIWSQPAGECHSSSVCTLADAKLQYYLQSRECVQLSSSQDEAEYEQVDGSAETGFTITTNTAYSTVNI